VNARVDDELLTSVSKGLKEMGFKTSPTIKLTRGEGGIVQLYIGNEHFGELGRNPSRLYRRNTREKLKKVIQSDAILYKVVEEPISKGSSLTHTRIQDKRVILTDKVDLTTYFEGTRKAEVVEHNALAFFENGDAFEDFSEWLISAANATGLKKLVPGSNSDRRHISITDFLNGDIQTLAEYRKAFREHVKRHKAYNARLTEARARDTGENVRRKLYAVLGEYGDLEVSRSLGPIYNHLEDIGYDGNPRTEKNNRLKISEMVGELRNGLKGHPGERKFVLSLETIFRQHKELEPLADVLSDSKEWNDLVKKFKREEEEWRKETYRRRKW
jgi:hypothetical protein